MSKFVHGVIIGTTNCTVMFVAEGTSEARWKYEGNTGGKKVRNMWFTLRKKKMIEIIFYLMCRLVIRNK